jgi:hypothetical protein
MLVVIYDWEIYNQTKYTGTEKIPEIYGNEEKKSLREPEGSPFYGSILRTSP